MAGIMEKLQPFSNTAIAKSRWLLRAKRPSFRVAQLGPAFNTLFITFCRPETRFPTSHTCYSDRLDRSRRLECLQNFMQARRPCRLFGNAAWRGIPETRQKVLRDVGQSCELCEDASPPQGAGENAEKLSDLYSIFTQDQDNGLFFRIITLFYFIFFFFFFLFYHLEPHGPLWAPVGPYWPWARAHSRPFAPSLLRP